MCTVEGQIAAPRRAGRPGAGSIQFAMELLTMAHPSATESALDGEVEECLTMLETLYRDTYCIDFDTLCIEMNQFVYDIKCQLKVLDYDGGLFDCSTLAVTTALMGFKRNDVTYDGIAKKLISHSPSERPMIPLTMVFNPATLTFGFVDGIDDPIVDPSESECVCVNGFLVIGTNRRDEICLMFQSGRLNITPENIIKCADVAIEHAKEMANLMTAEVRGTQNADIVMK